MQLLLLMQFRSGGNLLDTRPLAVAASCREVAANAGDIDGRAPLFSAVASGRSGIAAGAALHCRRP
jgi:hypothetical protein